MQRLARSARWLKVVVAGAVLLLGIAGPAPAAPPPCGTAPNPCCPPDQGPPCVIGNVCLNGFCALCGFANEPCCTGDFCTMPSLLCTGGLCKPCGQATQPCCGSDPACQTGTTCSADNTCVPCGQENQPCCENDFCLFGNVCLQGTCEACGSVGEPCCQQPIMNSCLPGDIVCRDGECVECGALGEPCCNGNTCEPPGMCGIGMLCNDCGFPMQPSCTPTATRTATVTRTPTVTVTATPTNTPRPNGADCTTPSECGSGFCADGVCCNTACDDPDEFCDGPQPGDCRSLAAAAPTLSWPGTLLAGVVLSAIAAVALWRRRRV